MQFYPPDTRRKILDEIKRLKGEGKTYPQIRDALERQGFKTPSGGKLKVSTLAALVAYTNKLTKKGKQPGIRGLPSKEVVTMVAHNNRENEAIRMILQDPTISPDKKISIIKAYLE